MRRTVALVAALSAIVLIAACPGGCPKPDAKQPPPPGVDATADSVSVAEEVPVDDTPRLYVDKLPLSLEGPIVVSFPRAFAAGAWVNKEVDEETILDVSPTVKGELIWSARDELRMQLDRPLRYATDYRVELKQVKTRDGVLKPEADEDWSLSFTTPAFELRYVDLERFDRRRGMVRALLTFTGAPDLKSLRQRLQVKAGDEIFSAFKLSPHSEPRRVVLELSSGRLLRLEEITVEVKGEVREAKGRASWDSGGEWSLDLSVPGYIKVSNVEVKETAGGFEIRLLCEDEVAVKKHEGRRWGYDMCPLDVDDLMEAVHVQPKVNFSVATQRNGFKLIGDFKGGSYVLAIDSGLTAKSGGVLTQTFERSLQIPHRSPSISFTSQGRYLPRAMLSRVPISHINLSETQLTVRKVHPQNLIFWLGGDSEAATESTSDQVASVTLPLKGDTDVKTASLVDLRDVITGDQKGVFELRMHKPPPKPKKASDETGEEDEEDEEEDGYDEYDGYDPYGSSRREATEATARVVLTDLTIVAKRYGAKGEQLRAWVLDAATLQPVSGAAVKLYSKSNRLLAQASSDGEGGCSLDVSDDKYEAAPFAIVVQRGDDLSFLAFADLEIQLGEAEVQGHPYTLEQAYIASVYTDRGVYRPGETAHIVGLLRTAQDVAPKAGLPVRLKIWDPRTKLAAQRRGTSNAAGMVSFDFEAAAFAATGPYRADLEVGGKVVASQRFNVEEFVPERMKVSAKSEKQGYLQGEEAAVEVEARYLFGPKAAGEKVELACTLQPSQFKSETFKDFTFNPWSEKKRAPISMETVSGSLDEEGKASIRCPGGDAVGRLTGPAKMNALASVFEAGSGRTSVAKAEVPVHPDRFYVGLRSGQQELEANQEVEVQGVLVDWDGKLLKESRQIEMRLMALEMEWNWESQVDDLGVRRHRWRHYYRPVMVGKKTVQAKAGRFSYSFRAPSAGSAYLVRARADSVQADLQIARRWAWSYWGSPSMSTDQTPKPQQPTGMQIKAPADVEVGKTAKASFKAPYAGRALITVETDRLVESRWLDVKEGVSEFDFTVEKFVPNVYLSALLIKDPRQESAEAFLPGRAFGARAVKVAPKSHSFEVKLSVPDEVRPNSPLKVGLQLSPGTDKAFATVAAVDEGILSLTRFKTPDVLADLFARRALGVRTFETVGWTLLLPPSDAARSPGGDGEGGGRRGRIMPVKPVALWSGIVEVGADGKAEVSLDVPQYRGELRVMAVAASASRAGSAEASVPVRDPLVLQATFPRFLLAQDRFVLPVFLTNLTGKDGSFKVDLTVGPGLDLDEAVQQSVKIAAGQSATVVFGGRAKRSFGAARFSVRASGNGVTSHDDAEIPFLPNGPLHREVSLVGLEKGNNDLRSAFAGWVPETETTSVWVTTNPYGREFGHLRYLARYPYGCIEQTTSSTRPLLHLASLLEAIDPKFVSKAGIEKKFMHGVNRLLSMQTAGGGFAYWPGNTEPTYWGTAYATHLLLEGREAGFPIADDRIDDAIRFIEKTLSSGSGRSNRYGGVGAAEPYMQFVLAKAGKARKGRLRHLIKKSSKRNSEVSSENLFLLQAALYLAGDHSHASDLKQAFAGEISERRRNGWTFWSDFRSRGMQLNIMEDLFKGSAAAEPLAQAVAARLRAQRHSYSFTTQELAWAVSGLGKRVGSVSSEFAEAKLLVDGKPVALAPQAGKKKKRDPIFSVDGASGAKRIDLQLGKASGKVYAVVTVEGVKPDVPWDYGDNGLKVRRVYRNVDGDRVDPRDLDLGDVVHVELTLANQTNERVRNLALVDRFGAGLEIENPRLGRERRVDWIEPDDLWDVEYMNIRDDRIELFGHLERGQSVTVVYTARAVTAGQFTTPPVRVEAMYEPRMWSCQPGEPLRVRNPWEAS